MTSWSDATFTELFVCFMFLEYWRAYSNHECDTVSLTNVSLHHNPMIAHYCGADGQDGCDCTAGCIGCCCWYCTGPFCAWYWEYEKRKAVEVKLNGGIMVVDNCPIMDCCMVMRPQMYSWQYNIFSFKAL